MILPPDIEEIAKIDIEEIAKIMSSIDVEQAEASRPEDLEKVKHLIACNVGFAKVNEKVKGNMVDLLMKSIKQKLLQASQATHTSTRQGN